MKDLKDVNTEEVVEAAAATEVTETEAAVEEVQVSEPESQEEKQGTMLDIPTAINTVVARTEAVAIVVSIINTALDILQARDIKLTDEELGRIQYAVNMETEKTDKLYQQVEKAINGAVDGVTQAEPAETSEAAE